MTFKDKDTGTIQLITTNEVDLLGHMTSTFNKAWETTHEMYPSCQVMFSGLCGMDINSYNGYGGYHPTQPIIDRVIAQLNYHTTDLNFRAGVYQPKLTSKIRRSNHVSHRNQYCLLIDGIHPGGVVLADWAKNISSLFQLLVSNELLEK